MKAFFTIVIAAILVSQGMCDLYWSSWHNRDSQQGSGDFEPYYHLKCRDGYSPIKADCRLVSNNQDWSTAGDVIEQAYQCTTMGFVCRNNLQPVGEMCQNYKIRFLCRKP